MKMRDVFLLFKRQPFSFQANKIQNINYTVTLLIIFILYLEKQVDKKKINLLTRFHA